MPRELHVFAFGKLRMQAGDRVVETFPTRHVEELLGYLLVHPETAHNREKLIDMLWPDTATENARARFSTVLWRLRRLFGQIGLPPDHFLHVTRQSVSLAPRASWQCDLVSFEAYLAQAARAETGGQREQALRAAIDRYHGELFEGIYANWCLLERERLARLYLRAVGQLMVSLMRRAAYDDALVLGEAILTQDPLREVVHRAMMYCYWQSGQWQRANQQYERCARQLMDELEVLPMPETVNLYRQILAERYRYGLGEREGQEPIQLELQHAYQAFEQAAHHLSYLLERHSGQSSRDS